MRIVETLEEWRIKKFQRNMIPVDAEVNWGVIDSCGIREKFDKLGFTFAVCKDLFTKRTPYPMMTVRTNDAFIEVDGKKFDGPASPGQPLVNYSIFPDGEIHFNQRLKIKPDIQFSTYLFKLWGNDQMTTEWVLRVLYTILQHISLLHDAIREADNKRIDKGLSDAITELW